MLLRPPFQFANEVDNLTGTPPTAAPGTSFTRGASSADGAAVSVLSALAFDVHRLAIAIVAPGSSGVNRNTLVDVLSDPAGGTSWGSFIDDLVCGFAFQQSPVDCWAFYDFPIWIKAGTSLGVRGRNAGGTAGPTCKAVLWAFGHPNRPEQWWCGQKVESLGIDAASSAGTTVTPGDTGAWGSWTSVGAVTTGRYGAVQLGINGSDNDALGLGTYWQLGYGDTQLPGSPTLYCAMNTSEQFVRLSPGLIFCDIAVGTQMQARATATSTAENYNAAIYGVY